MQKANILGTGSFLPEKTLTNAEISQFVDTSDEWIQQRVGISSRHISSESDTTTSMAVAASEQALLAAGIAAKEIDLIVLATSTPDFKMPSTACEVQSAIGATKAVAFDVNAACSGFIYALSVAEQFFNTGKARHILVIGAERMSRVLDWQDRSTCVLFGDGAGAVVLGPGSDDAGIIASHIYSDGANRDLLFIPNNLSHKAFELSQCHSYLEMQGNKVFKFAVNKLGRLVDQVLAENNLAKSDIDWLVPHQANFRIIAATAKKFNLPMEKVILTLATHGNTSAASVALALDVAVRDGRVKRGDLLLMEAFGAGFTWGSVLVRY